MVRRTGQVGSVRPDGDSGKVGLNQRTEKFRSDPLAFHLLRTDPRAHVNVLDKLSDDVADFRLWDGHEQGCLFRLLRTLQPNVTLVLWENPFVTSEGDNIAITAGREMKLITLMCR